VPPIITGLGPAGNSTAHVPPADNYSLRLLARRRLYDAGSSVTGSPSLTPLVDTLVARANPYDLDRLGAHTGDQVRVRSARGALTLPAVADEGIPRGVVAVDFNVPGPGGANGTNGIDTPANAISTVIDCRQSVTDVRLESV
jgi:anaerobic selenocysteine-containing dehydrogenase